MKKKMLFALGICFALVTTKTRAQVNLDNSSQEVSSKFRDTIILIPNADIKVLLLGVHMREILRNTSLDSLKALLIADVEKARSQQGYPADAKLTHYFVSTNGKRRLKTQSEDFAEPAVNVEMEKQALEMELPMYEFIIYAVKDNYECHIYLKDPAMLNQLAAVNFNEALATVSDNKKIIRQSSRIDIEKKSSQWILKNHYGNKIDMLELTPSFGMSLLGSRWSPVVGFDLAIIFNDKYRRPYIKAGVGWNVFTFADWEDKEITNLSAIGSYDLKLLGNIATGDKPRWFGIEAGMMKTYKGQSPFDNKLKLGIAGEGFGAFNFSFDIILNNKKSIYALTLKLPF